MKQRTTTIHLRGTDARNFMKVVAVQNANAAEGNEGDKHLPVLVAMEAAQRELLARAESAEAERNALARKFAEVSDRMNGHNPPPTLCHACNICPANSDIEMEGVTCEVRLLEWAAAEAQREGGPA